jgi:hypothetical protein
MFWEVVDLERGPVSLMSTIEELLERKSSGSGLENWDHGCVKDAAPLYPQKGGTNFADKQWWLGQYSSLMDSGPGVFLTKTRNKYC